jgi:hypothetical protein
MSMPGLIGAGVSSVLIGCGIPRPVGETTALAEQGGAPQQTMIICPDGTTNCTQSNGAGVYTAEDGHVGIGPAQLMITHFINGSNNGSNVTFQGRFFDGQIWRQLPAPGTVYESYYTPGHGTFGIAWSVVSVRESATEPTWTLFDRESGQMREVTGVELADLTLFIQFTVPAGGGGNAITSYALEFSSPDAFSSAAGKPPVHTYNVRWRDVADANAQPRQYCSDAKGVADPIVLQQGMAADPVTGSVTRDSTTTGFVTMSCRAGALATVYSWGYPYRSPADTFYFDAGIPMKRASYCADSQYYTVAGTHIHIKDDKLIQNELIDHLEARWTPKGAMCLEPSNARHPEIIARKGFKGVCNGQPLPKCQGAPSAQYLADGSEK